MSDKATILQETVEAFADLHTMLDGLTEEQASRIRLGVLGVRDLVIQWPGMLCGCGGQISQAAERTEIEVQIFLGQAELRLHLFHSRFELHQSQPQIENLHSV